MRRWLPVLLLSACAFAQVGGGVPTVGSTFSGAGGGAAHTFTGPATANNRCYAATSSGSSDGCTLGTAPATGTLTIASVMSFPATITGVTVSDGTHSYAATASSPSSTNGSTAGNAWTFFWYATTTGGATITATYSGASCTACSITVNTFGVTGAGAVVVDVDAAGNGNGATVNTPTVTQGQAGDLYWCFAVSENGISASGGAPWTAEGHGVGTFGEEAQWLLSSSGSQACNFSQTSGNWDSIGTSFK